MRRIIVATDFSTRSDRAVRRAGILGRSTGADVTLLHVVDDDQPARMVETERAVAAELLADQARTLQEANGIACSVEVGLGEPFQAIAAVAAQQEADLIVIGQHRREVLRDLFLGTTAERTIRTARLPVLMVPPTPAGPYRAVLAATDLTDTAAHAMATVQSLGLAPRAIMAALHVFVPLGVGGLARATVTRNDLLAAEQAEAASASAELDAHLATIPGAPEHRIVRSGATGIAPTICDAARQLSADLIVLGTRHRWALETLLLGSVSGEVLRYAPCDVLAVPPLPS